MKKDKVGDDFGDVIQSHDPTFNQKYLESSDEYWEGEDPEFFALMERIKRGADKDTVKED